MMKWESAYRLFETIEWNDLKSVREMLKNVADANANNYHGVTALMHTAGNDYMDVARFIEFVAHGEKAFNAGNEALDRPKRYPEKSKKDCRFIELGCQ